MKKGLTYFVTCYDFKNSPDSKKALLVDPSREDGTLALVDRSMAFQKEGRPAIQK